MDTKAFARLFLCKATAKRIRTVNTTPRKDGSYGDAFVVAYLTHQGRAINRESVKALTEEMFAMGNDDNFFVRPTSRGFSFCFAADAPRDAGKEALCQMGLS